ncbi:hypothetical protein [Sphingomonas bacterium]|uniref:hypothetical protein n=1 Tax=Sphingomonas bacterium TaxID=1895847 RepID=UPI001575FD1A|nr:hypothetical protein [Sphingomonas bacterium]
MTSRTRAPSWFIIVALILLLWGLLGCYSCLQQLRLGAEAMGPASAYDRALYAALPAWYNPCFAVAVLSGTLGAAALLARLRAAVPLAVVALVTVVIMFCYMFVATDIIAHKGAAVATGFPAIIVLIAIGQLWLARTARARRWIG